MRTAKKVFAFPVFVAILCLLVFSIAEAKNPHLSNGPKWKENPSHSSGPKGPESNPPGNQEPLTPASNSNAPKGPSSPAGKSDIGHLYLYQKIEPAQPYPPNTPWAIDPDGAWGKMRYRLSGALFEYVFNGRKLIPEEEYTLIYYPDPWPGSGLICLGTGTANRGGNVHIATAADIGTDLPIATDLNNPKNLGHETCVLGSTCIDGAKIWLVLSSDVDCVGRSMVGWDPEEYLFEDVGIFFDYTGSVVP